MAEVNRQMKSSLCKAVTFLVLMLVLYVLSVGPVLVCAERFGISRTGLAVPLRAFYSPVLTAARSCRVATDAYEGYVGMWHRIILGRGIPNDARYK
jgi:hypothetical protein